MGLTTIFFIRHGEVNNPKNIFYGRSFNLHLNELGIKKVEKLAKRMKLEGQKIDVIYVSPLIRSQETAKIIAKIFNNLPIWEIEELTDVDIPALVGHSLKERDEIHKKGVDEYFGEFVKKGNESRNDIARRMLKAFNKIYSKHKGENILVISHGDPLRFLFFSLTNPGKQLPSVGELKKSYYPQKGEGWKMVIGKTGKILKTEFIH